MFRTVLAGVLMVLAATTASAETRLALLIGNEDYPASVGQLQNPHQDVDLMQAALTDIGFETVVLKDGDKSAIEAGIGGYIARLADEEDAVAFFYYSGHGGSQEVRGRRKNYLIPSGADITTSAQLPFAGVALDTIVDAIAASDVKAAFIVSDACRNTLAMAGASKGGAPADRSFGVEQRRPGLYIANATADGETAPDDGRFAKALSEQLRVSGQYAPRAFSLAFREVARQREGYRLPSASDALNEDICFNGCPSDAVAASMTRSPAEIAEEEAWLGALNGDGETGYSAYLATYPAGRYSAVASAFLERARSVAATGGSFESVPKRPVDPDAWPEFAAVRINAGDRKYVGCGATMVSPRWGISEAACLGLMETSRFASARAGGEGLDDLDVVPAAGVASSDTGLLIAQLVFHPDYSDNGGVPENDIVLFELNSDWPAQTAELRRSATTSPLPEIGAPVEIVGFGATENGVNLTGAHQIGVMQDGRSILSMAKAMHSTEVLVVDDERCAIDDLFEQSRLDPATFFCAIPSSEGAGACIGDGGAGVWSRNPDGTRRLLGHVSFGAGCFVDDGFEGFVDHAHYADWIVDVIGAEALYGNREVTR